jgi:tetratricopeptide (TPR) repeat protein
MKKAVTPWACALALIVLAGCSDSEQAKREFFANGERFLKENKYQEAIVEFRNAIQQDEKYGEARLKLGDAYAAAGNPAGAFREYVRAADLLPQNNDAQIKAATFLIMGGQFDDARTRILPVVERDPTNVEAQLLFGNALAGLKDLDGAVKEIEGAIELDPERGLTYTNLAVLRLAQGQKDQALAAYQKAVEVDPRSIIAWLALANFQWSAGDSVAAETSLKRALEVDPKHVLANNALAVLYMSSRRTAEAEPYLKTIADTGIPEAAFQLADYYMGVRRYDDAVAVLQPLTKESATAGEAEARLAAIAYAQNDKPRGHSLVDAAIKRDPGNSTALLLKSRFLESENKFPEARDSAQAAVKANPNSIAAHYALGTLQARLRQRKEAIASFSQVLQLNPRAAAAQLYLSRLTLQEGTPDGAVSYAEGALANAPGNPEARASLIRGLLAKRETARAEQEVATLLKEFPNVGLVHALDGAVRQQKNDASGARASYEKGLSLNPNSIEALAGLTAVDLFQKQIPQARARIEARLAAQPDRPELMLLASQVYAAQGDVGRAETMLRRAIQSDPSSTRAYSMLAAVLLAAGKLDAARAEFDQMSQRDPKNVAAQTMAAMIVHSQNKTADAKKRYETILNADPTAAVAANNLAWIYAEEGERLDEALRLAQSAATKLPENPEVSDTIGWIYYKKELPALAVPAFERSVEKAPDNASYHYHLALALASSGDTRRARAAVQEALKLKPDYAEARKLLSSL